MPAQRSTIALRSERVTQLKEMANLAQMPVTEYLEELIRKEARREQVPLPGLMAYYNIETHCVVFGYRVTSDGESIPLTTLTPDEARLVARHLLDAMKSPRRVHNPIETSSNKLIEIGRQGIAATLDVILPDDTVYQKSLSRSMVMDVAGWLNAAADAAENV